MPKVSISFKGVACIYAVLSPTNKIYIGQTWDLYHRYKSGVSKHQRLLYRSYQKHGEESHKLFTILEFKGPFTQADLDYWERYYIDVYKAEGYQLLNIREGGGNNGKLAEETKALIAVKSRNWKASNPELVRQIALKAASANIGKKRSAETKFLQSRASAGKPKTKEHAMAVSLAKRGKPSPHKGKHFSPEAVARIREAIKGRNQKKCPVNQMSMNGEFIKQWSSIQCAAMETGIHKATITGCVHGVRSYLSAGGYKWEYTNEADKIAYQNRIRKSNNTGKPITQLTIEGIFVSDWNSMNEAAIKLNIQRGDIRLCCQGARKSAGGYIWKYK